MNQPIKIFKITSVRKAGFRGASIVATLHGGDRFTLKHQFESRDSMKLLETLEKIRAVGEIDLTYWRPFMKGEY